MRTFVERNAVRVETPFGTVTNFPLEGRIPTSVIETNAPYLDHITIQLPVPIPALEERRVIVEEPCCVCGCRRTPVIMEEPTFIPSRGRVVIEDDEPCCCEESNLEDVILDLAEQIKMKQMHQRSLRLW